MKESVLLRQTREYLTIMQRLGKLTFRRIHVHAIPRGRTGEQFKVLGKNRDMEGMEDIQIWLPDKFLAVELKSDSGRQKPAQILRQEQLERLGHGVDHYPMSEILGACDLDEE